MPRILGQVPGGFNVEFDDGTTGAIPDYLAEGLIGQGMGLGSVPSPEPPAPAPLPEQPPPDAFGAAPGLGVPQLAPPTTPPTTVPINSSQPAPAPAQFATPATGRGVPQAVSTTETFAPVQAAAEARKANVREAGEITAQKSEAAQPFLDRETAERESRAAATTEAGIEFRKSMEAYDRQIADRQAAVAKVDPQRAFKDMGAGKRIMLILAGIAAGKSGNLNQFMGMLNSVAERDVQAQLADIDSQHKAIAGAERSAERGKLNFLERSKLENEAYMDRLGAIKSGLNAEMGKYEAPLIRKDFQDKILAIDEQIAERYTQARQLHFQTAMQAANARAEQAHQRNMEALGWARERREATEFGLKLEQLQAEREAAAIKAAASNRLLDPQINGGRELVIGKQTADKDQRLKNWSDKESGISGYAALADFTKQYIAKAEQLGRTYAGPGSKGAAVVSQQQQLRSELASLRDQGLQAYRKNNFGASFTAGEEKVFNSIFPEPDKITGPEGARSLRTFLKTKATEAQKNFVNPLGLQDGATGKPVDLVKEWGTVEETVEPKFMDAPALLESGAKAAAGLQSLPPKSPAAREQVKFITSRADEIMKRAKSFADRSGMTPEVGAQAVEQLKQFSTMLTGAGFDTEGDKVWSQALQLTDQISNPPPGAGYTVARDR